MIEEIDKVGYTYVSGDNLMGFDWTYAEKIIIDKINEIIECINNSEVVTRLEDRIKELEGINEEHQKLNGELRKRIKELEGNTNEYQ